MEDGLFEGTALLHDFLLQQDDGLKEHFRPWRASGNIHINRNELVYALDDGIVIENPT